MSNVVTVLAIQMMRRHPATFPEIKQNIPYSIVALVFDETDPDVVKEKFLDPIHQAFENLFRHGSIDRRQNRFYLPEVPDEDHLHKFFMLLQDLGAVLVFSNAAEL